MSRSGRREPLVAVIYTVPLVYEAIASALDDIAEVRSFPGRSGDTVGLLRSVRPDAVVVDDPAESAQVQDWAESQNLPLMEIRLRERKIRVLRNGKWEESAGASAGSIRNAIAGSIYARDEVRS
jgi:hypothetical protein